MVKRINLAGKRYGRLLVQSYAGVSSRRYASWVCLCDCGNTKIVESFQLRRGSIASCGCWRQDCHITHAMSGTPAYKSWSSMVQRCTNRNDSNWSDYGGRGITVCDRWLEFENFFSDMGERPNALTLERIDNSKGYEPDNCKWASRYEQAQNRRPKSVKKR